MAKKGLSITPLELIDIFYDEARRITSNEDEAERLANDAVKDFLTHYRLVKQRARSRRNNLSDTHLAIG